MILLWMHRDSTFAAKAIMCETCVVQIAGAGGGFLVALIVSYI